MWRPVKVTVPPAAEPLTLAQAKLQVVEEDNDNDALLTAYIAAARGQIEAMTGTRLITQTVELKTDCWADLARLPIAPVQSVVITYIDRDGDEQTLPDTVYEARLDGLEPMVVLRYRQAWPGIQPGSLIKLTAVVGYGDANAQETAVLQSMRLLVADMFAFRESAQVGSVASKIPVLSTVETLLANHKMHLI